MSYLSTLDSAPHAAWPSDQRIVYIVDLSVTSHAAGIVVELATERQKPGGAWELPVPFRIAADAWQSAPDPVDRQIAQMLIGAPPPTPHVGPTRTSGFVLRGAALDTTLRLICSTGRCRVRRVPGEQPVDAIGFDDGPAWQFRLRVAHREAGESVVEGVLRREGEEMPLQEPTMLHSEGLLLARGAFARFDHGGAFALVSLFREKPSVRVPDDELSAMLESLYTLPRRPALELPPDARINEVRIEPQPGVSILPDSSDWRQAHHRLEPFFLYGTHRVDMHTTDATLFDRDTLTVHPRDLARERAARGRLVGLGAKEEAPIAGRARGLSIHSSKLIPLVTDLVNAGWRVEAEGVEYRAAANAHASVTSGIDWFELSAGVRYGDIEVSLQELLAARRKGATMIELSDGSPRRHSYQLARATRADRRRRHAHRWIAALFAFSNSAARRAARHAPRSRRRRDLRQSARRAARLRQDRAARPTSLIPRDAARIPARRTRLASLPAHLRTRRLPGRRHGARARPFRCSRCSMRGVGRRKSRSQPSIVVVPRSLVFNWLREAERFTPKLRVLDHSGTGRQIETIDGERVDLVITTYGTLRRDIAQLAEIPFDYAILDEAQAIKTPSSASAKAARLLRADHRLAMTGTPIENRIEELWSIFEFLNPGMLGPSSTFRAARPARRPGRRGRRPRRARPCATAGDPAAHQGPGGHRPPAARRADNARRARGRAAEVL